MADKEPDSDGTSPATAKDPGATDSGPATPVPSATGGSESTATGPQQVTPQVSEVAASALDLLEPRKPPPASGTCTTVCSPHTVAVIVQFKHAAGAPQLKKEKSKLKCKTVNNFKVGVVTVLGGACLTERITGCHRSLAQTAED